MSTQTANNHKSKLHFIKTDKNVFLFTQDYKNGQQQHMQQMKKQQINNKNSSGDEIANVNFYAMHQEATRNGEIAEIMQNNTITPFKVIQGHRLWYQSKAHI